MKWLKPIGYRQLDEREETIRKGEQDLATPGVITRISDYFDALSRQELE